MFENSRAFSSFAVDDIGKAKQFYGETLGLDVQETDMSVDDAVYTMLTLNVTGGNGVLVYPKSDHSPAVFTVLNFPVDDIETTVDELGRRGVRFEQYGGDIATDEKGIHRNGDHSVAWFRDPAGNILAVMQES
ncbi:MAG: VOC family protein [Proteobacteria bacterium]|nr:VOC family protein [Pseudomonadota bacterium]